MQVTMNHEQFGMPRSRRISDRAQARTRSDAKSPAVAPEIGSARLARKGAHRRGFTLVEMLVVLIIIGLLAAMGMAALFGTLSIARRSATRSLIEKVNAGLQDRLRSLDSRVIKVLPVDRQLAGANMQRAQVIAKKRVMKEEFPQWFFVDPGSYDLVGDWDPLYTGTVNQTAGQVSAVARGYRAWVTDLALRTGVDANLDGQVDVSDSARLLTDVHDPRTTSAECLYLIITRGPGTSEINEDSFTESEVGDTDGDGLLEFIDAFGNPLRFYRWPTHYSSPIQKGMGPYQTSQDPRPSERREDDSMDPNRTLVGHWKLLTETGLSGGWSGGVAFRSAVSRTPDYSYLSAWPAFHELYEPILCTSETYVYNDTSQLDLDIPNLIENRDTRYSAAWRWNAAFVANSEKFNAPGTAQIRVDDQFRAYKTTPLIISSGADQLFGLVDFDDLPSGRKGMTLQGRIIAEQPEDYFQLHEDNGAHMDNLTNHQQLGGS